MNSRINLWMNLAPVVALACLQPESLRADSGDATAIYPDKPAQLISWGYDVKEPGRAPRLTPELAQTLYGDDQMTSLRVPIYGDGERPAHPADGQVVGSYYDDTLKAMANARKVQPKVLFFASKKLENTKTFPPWVLDSDGVKPEAYARMLADYLAYMEAHGFVIDILGVDNEVEWNKGNITPEKYRKIVDELTSLSKTRGFTLPKYFLGPDSYYPTPDWVREAIRSGTRLDIVGVHYYPERPIEKLKAEVEAAGDKPIWHTELHKGKTKNGHVDGAEVTLATFFDCTDLGVSNFIWWSYDREKTMSGLEKAIVQSTVNTRPIKADNPHDGSIIRAFMGKTNITVWAINSSENNPDTCQIHLASGTITGDVTYERWTKAGEKGDSGKATSGDPNTFTLDLPPKTITEFVIPYTSSTAIAGDKNPPVQK